MALLQILTSCVWLCLLCIPNSLNFSLSFFNLLKPEVCLLVFPKNQTLYLFTSHIVSLLLTHRVRQPSMCFFSLRFNTSEIGMHLSMLVTKRCVTLFQGQQFLVMHKVTAHLIIDDILNLREYGISTFVFYNSSLLLSLSCLVISLTDFS